MAATPFSERQTDSSDRDDYFITLSATSMTAVLEKDMGGNGYGLIKEKLCKIDENPRQDSRWFYKFRASPRETQASSLRIMCSTGGKTRRTYFTLDGPGIESRWSRYLPCPSRPTPGPTQPLVHLGSLSSGYSGQGVALTIYPPSSAKVKE